MCIKSSDRRFKSRSQSHVESLLVVSYQKYVSFCVCRNPTAKSASYHRIKDPKPYHLRFVDVFNDLTMTDPSLEWMIDKDNPPKDNLSDVKMTSPSDPKPLRFVSPPASAQPTNSTTHSDNDDMLTKTDIMEDISLMMSDCDVTMSSAQTEKVVESPLPCSGISLQLSTTHSKSTDNTENNPNITPSPPPSPPPTSPTKSVRKIREKTLEKKQTKSKRTTHKEPRKTSRRIKTTIK